MILGFHQANIKDSEIIAKLSEQLGYQTTEDDIRNRLLKILAHNDNYLIVVEFEDKVVGWVHAFYSIRIESEPFVEIGGIVVDQNYRRLGIGSKLIDEIKGWAALKGINKLRIRCNVVRKETHEFYKRLGFTETKEQKIFDLKINK